MLTIVLHHVKTISITSSHTSKANFHIRNICMRMCLNTAFFFIDTHSLCRSAKFSWLVLMLMFMIWLIYENLNVFRILVCLFVKIALELLQTNREWVFTDWNHLDLIASLTNFTQQHFRSLKYSLVSQREMIMGLEKSLSMQQNNFTTFSSRVCVFMWISFCCLFEFRCCQEILSNKSHILCMIWHSFDHTQSVYCMTQLVRVAHCISNIFQIHLIAGCNRILFEDLSWFVVLDLRNKTRQKHWAAVKHSVELFVIVAVWHYYRYVLMYKQLLFANE